jgi:peptidyl-prolyl cis-trans isomerase C
MKIRVVFAIFAAVVTLLCQASAADKPKNTAESTNKAAAVAAPAPVTGEVVARVNGAEIKRKELDAAMQAFAAQMTQRGHPVLRSQNSEMEQGVLEGLIGRGLLLQEGNKHIPADVDKKVQQEADQLKAQLGGEEGFKKMLADSGMTSEEYIRRIRDTTIVHETIQAVIDKEIKLPADEVKGFYDKNPDQFKQPELVRASHILIRCPPNASDEMKKAKRAQIEAARALVKGGEKFADVAKKVSEDPGSAPSGGDLGFFTRGRMVPEFDTAAFSLKTNEVSSIITTQYGYHVLVVTDRKPARTLPFDEVKEELAKFLKQQKGNEVARNHVAELRQVAKIEILLPGPRSAPAVVTPPVHMPGK